MPFPVSWFRRIPFGRRSEIDGADYLRGLGFRVVASQYRIPAGEVDLIAWEGDVLVFVEVKARASEAPPEDAVGLHKQQRVIRAAHSYLARYQLQDRSYRFDILALTAIPNREPIFRLLRDAFRESPRY
jgi:putative endonuclease